MVCAPASSYAGPDGARVELAGSCTDLAGNIGGAVYGLSYDSTGPVVAADTSRAPDAGGWFNRPVSVSFTGTDALSGGVVCDAPIAYAGPDDGSARAAGGCTDAAGNSARAVNTFRYDATAPVVSAAASRPADSNGWYNAPLSVSFSGDDATSGSVVCDAAKSYAGPDNARGELAGSCTDLAGNVGSAIYGFSYDATAPVVSGAASRPADSNGWYNAPLSV